LSICPYNDNLSLANYANLKLKRGMLCSPCQYIFYTLTQSYRTERTTLVLKIYLVTKQIREQIIDLLTILLESIVADVAIILCIVQRPN
jgi:hypothetical protein